MLRYVLMLNTWLGWMTVCQMTSSNAAKAEFAKEYNQAFRLYIKAAESFLYLSRSSTQSDKTKQQWKANASKALERAERIKMFVEKSTARPASNHQSPPLRLAPVAINHFSPRKSLKWLHFRMFSLVAEEQLYVLRKGGNVNGLNFPLWDDPVQSSSNPSYKCASWFIPNNCTPHKDTPVTQMVNPNFHQTNKKIYASGNDPIKGRANLWTYCADESCQRIFYNTLLPTVLFVPQFQSALSILEDLGPM